MRLTELTDLTDKVQVQELNRMLRELLSEAGAGNVPVDVIRPADHNATNPSTSTNALKPGDSLPRLVAVPKTVVEQDGEYVLKFFNGKRLEVV